MHTPKKSLGQNFLKSGSALTSIVSAAQLTSSDVVLEIGPGKGALTERLLATGSTVVAVEKDADLIQLLSEKFSSYIAEKKFILLEDDILNFNPESMRAYGKTYKLVANIPYYITGAIIRMFLETTATPSLMVLLVQKEVAMRIVARDKKESILSLSVKAFATPTYITKVPAKSFSPAPKVDSAVLKIADISHTRFTHITPQLFFDVIHAGFAHKRKFLSRNLETYASKETITRAFTDANISPKARAEDISIDTWFILAELLSKI